MSTEEKKDRGGQGNQSGQKKGSKQGQTKSSKSTKK